MNQIDYTKENGCFEINELCPIPLTPQILEMCGFKEFYNKTFFIIAGELLINIDGGYWWSNAWGASDNFGFETLVPYKKIESLHQLQNLYYALTEEELTFKP